MNKQLSIPNFLTTREPHVRKNHTPKRGSKKPNFSSSSENHPKYIITGHHIKWSYKLIGTPKLKGKKVYMKNWVKRIYYPSNSITIVANPNTLEVWIKKAKPISKKHTKRTIRMLYTAWDKADRAARAFAKRAHVSLEPILSKHPADLHSAHMVVETKKLNKYLKPQAGIKTSEKVGLMFDKSHRNKPEFAGEYSSEGAIGLDWLFLKYPFEFRGMRAEVLEFNQSLSYYNQNIKLHMKVMQDIRDGIKELREELKRR